MHKQIYSLKCSYYAHALSCAHFGKLQIIYKKSGWRVKNQVLMIFDALVNIFPGNSLGWGTKFCNWKDKKDNLWRVKWHSLFDHVYHLQKNNTITWSFLLIQSVNFTSAAFWGFCRSISMFFNICLEKKYRGNS